MHRYLFFLINKQKFYWKNTTSDTCMMNIKESKELQKKNYVEKGNDSKKSEK